MSKPDRKFSVADIEIDKLDSAGRKVEIICAKCVPLFAVYIAGGYVVVHYADDLQQEIVQRARILQLNPLRGEISALIRDWLKKRPHLARRYQNGLADTLIGALQNDISGSLAILQSLKSQIYKDHEAWGRQLYLIFATLFALGLITLTTLVGYLYLIFKVHSVPDQNLFISLGAGAAGALFSIAQTINRKVTLPNLQMVSTAADAMLRVGIGVVAAGFLFCLLGSKLIALSIGNQSLNELTTSSWYALVTIGFLAGFSEQLAPNLLGQIEAGIAAVNPNDNKPEAPKTPAERAVAHAIANPDITTDSSPEEEDACLCDHPHGEDEATPDNYLPIAVGGVEAPKTGANP